jgi:hypothetical protein
MEEKMSKVPGFDLPVPGRNELRPNERDKTPEKGPLAYVKPSAMVYDLGAPRDELTYWRGTPSPASPTFKAGVPLGVNPSVKPEEEAARIHTGIVAGERSKKTTEEGRKGP